MQHEKPEAARRFDKLPDSAHVRARVVAVICDVSEPTVWRWSRPEIGRLPAPKRIGPQTTVWNVGELRQKLAIKR